MNRVHLAAAPIIGRIGCPHRSACRATSCPPQAHALRHRRSGLRGRHGEYCATGGHGCHMVPSRGARGAHTGGGMRMAHGCAGRAGGPAAPSALVHTGVCHIPMPQPLPLCLLPLGSSGAQGRPHGPARPRPALPGRACASTLAGPRGLLSGATRPITSLRR